MTADASISTPRTFADAEVVLARALPGYESREQQQRLARAVEEVFARDENFRILQGDDDQRDVEHLLAQAGTGVGKSLGYLIPSILSGRRVVVSVTTKALQDQLAQKDIPFLEEHLGVPFSWALLKGRSNYFCVNKALTTDEIDVPQLPEVMRFLRENPAHSGLRSDLPMEFTDAQWWKVCGESEECSANGCSSAETDTCYADRARKEARDANLVIVNHALFLTDLMLKGVTGGVGMIDSYDLVVFDEAHELEEIAGNTLGAQLTEGTFSSLASEVRNFEQRHLDGEDDLAGKCAAMMAATQALFGRLQPGRLRVKEIEDAGEELVVLYETLEDLRAAINAVSLERVADYTRAKKVKDRLRRRTANAGERMQAIVADPLDETVRWVEEETTRRGEKRKVLKYAPIVVSGYLRSRLFLNTPAILVSATLAVKRSFSYIATRLGIDHYTGLDVGTSFDFAKQGRFYVPQGLPEPARHQIAVWEAQATEEIVELLKASRGRALVLFTSTKQMRDTFASVKRRVPQFECRMQGEAPPNQLVEWLKSHPAGVIFGSKSFMTGIDVQGEALSLVVMVKMPFPVPTEPLTEARCEVIEANGGNAFEDYSIPVMSLVLQQAFGRLIRHRNDTGVVAMLDPRIVTKGYGKTILRDLPPMGLTRSMEEVQAFFGTTPDEPVTTARAL